MGIYSLGAESSANKETRILKLKSYLNMTKADGQGSVRYNSATALDKAGVYSWKTLLSYLNYIEKHYKDNLNENGLENLKIAKREVEFLAKKH